MFAKKKVLKVHFLNCFCIDTGRSFSQIILFSKVSLLSFIFL